MKSAVWPEWSLPEIRLVEEHYGRMTRAELVTRHLPGRTIKGLEHVAALLGLTKRRPVPDLSWTADRLGVLRRHYGQMSAQDLQQRYFPQCSVRAIAHRARRLGLRMKEPNWTARERAIVRRHYHRVSNKTIAARYLPHRSAEAIQSCASNLGLTRGVEPV
jgi:hypothetical protein